VMRSATIVDSSCHTLFGQTVEAFYVSAKHAQAFTVGINCALQAFMAAGAVAMLGTAPVIVDKVDDTAEKLSEASYPFLNDIDWTSDVYAELPTQGVSFGSMHSCLHPQAWTHSWLQEL
jgi:hypothetical protein